MFWLELWQNLSGGEDADEVFDELLKKHGKVVYRRGGDQKSDATEADDDAESLSCELLFVTNNLFIAMMIWRHLHVFIASA